jgi:methionine biosynthesis protein MetW
MNIQNSNHQATRVDLLLMAEMVESGSRVLDVGCGDGTLLRILAETRDVDARGIELQQTRVNQCVARGLSVVQGDADTDLVNYPDNAFDYAILSQTIQATNRPRDVMEQLLRICKHAIVSFPNFGHWSVRSQIMFRGRMPVTENLTFSWYDTPNIHFCTIKDFLVLCDELGVKVEKSVALNAQGQRLGLKIPSFMQNMLGQQAIFLLSR